MKTSDENTQEIGEHLRRWRIMLHLTQQIAADRARISVPTLRRIEKGDPTVKLGTLMKLLHVLGVDRHVVDSVNPLNHELGRYRAHLVGKKRVN